MQYGFSLVVRGEDANPDTFAAIAERSEALELDSLWLSAHIIVPPQVKSDYALVPGRKHGEHWKDNYWEPFTILSYLCAMTSKITLGTSIVVLPMHNPFELAKQVAEVDQLSRGRFVFGIGVGWFEEEFEILGQAFNNRGKRTDEALELMHKLWTEEPVTFEGQYYNVTNASFRPKPVQKPGPPIWVAGGSDASLRRAARFGSAFHPVRPSYDYIRETRGKLNTLLDEYQRPHDSVDIAVKVPVVFDDNASDPNSPTIGTPQAIVDSLQRFQDLGASHFVLDIEPERLQVALDTMERFAQEVRPKL